MAFLGLKNLCTPASIYLVISLIALFIILFQNQYNSNTFCMGNYSCDVSNIYLIIIMKIIYIFLWTLVLNLVCKSGAPILAWILLLFPVVFMFIFITMLFTYNVGNISTSYT